MNFVFLITLVSPLLPELTRTEGIYPGLVVNNEFYLISPGLKKIDTLDEGNNMAPAYTNFPREPISYLVCPARDQWQRDINGRSVSKNALFYRKRSDRFIFLDQPTPKCESPIRGAIKEGQRNGENIEYTMRFEIYTGMEVVRVGNKMVNREKFVYPELLDFEFNETTKTMTHVYYSIESRTFMPTGSNKRNTIPFDKNQTLLGADLDSLYTKFRDLTPFMGEEKWKNQLAFSLGIQKLQLAPKDDFILDSWKTATITDVNTAPVWKILLLKWNAVEIFVRKLVKTNGVSVHVITGVSGTLSTVHRYYSKKEEKTLRVPKYVWKIVSHVSRVNQRMLIVMHNDPFSKPLAEDYVCEDVCTSYGWPVANRDYRTGFVYCCEMTNEVARRLDISMNCDEDAVMDISSRSNGSFKLDNVVSNPKTKRYDW